MTLVDSSIYIAWMRQQRNPTTILAPLLLTSELVSCGIVRIEVLRGITHPAARAEIGELFQNIPELLIGADVVDTAADLAWKLDRQGLPMPVPDLLIAACALKAGAILVTSDRDFARIPGLRTRTQLEHR